MNKKEDFIVKREKYREPRIEKTLKQKIASTQMRLNSLKSKDRTLSKKIETRQKIILGAEVAKAVGCDVMSIDKEFVLGLLLQAVYISDEDKIQLKLKGKKFLEEMVGRQE